MKKNLLRIGAFLAVVTAGFVSAGFAAGGNDKPQNEGVCPNFDTGHLSAGDAGSYTYTAPAGQVIVAICVKAGSINQGNGPEIIVYDPPVTSATFGHSSGKDISHFSVDLENAPDETEPPIECPGGDFNGDEEGCGEPPVECPDGDFNGQEPGCGEPPTETETEPPTETEPTTPEETTPPERCPPPNPDGSYGGKDGKPGNDECVPDPTTPEETTPEETEPPVTTTPEPPATTTPNPPTTVPPVTTPKKCKAPKKVVKGKCVKVKVVSVKPGKKPGTVIITTSDGETHVGVQGSG